MMPVIALFLCIVFTIFLFVLDKKNQVNTSWALWIPLLFVLIVASRPIVLWLNPGLSSEISENASDGSPYDLIFFIFLITSGIYILFKRRLNWSDIIRNNIWVFLLFFYCGISIIWSDVPRASLNAWIKVMVIPMMALIIITEEYPLEAIKTVLKRTAYVLIPLSVVLIKWFPAYGRSYSPFSGTAFYGGVTTYKNGLGELCLAIGLFLAWDFINILRKRSVGPKTMPILIDIVLIWMTIWLLVMANSATSYVGCIIGVCILLILEMPVIRLNLKYLNILVLGTLSLVFISFSFGIFESLVTSLGRDATLTGRTVIWEKALGMDSNPIIGTGYSSFWSGERGEFLLDMNWQRLTQAHNGYIEVYLNLGIIGLGFLIMIIIKTYKNSQNSLLTDFQYGKLRIMYLVVFFLSNITEASFVIKSATWFIFVLISLHYSRTTEHQA